MKRFLLFFILILFSCHNLNTIHRTGIVIRKEYNGFYVLYFKELKFTNVDFTTYNKTKIGDTVEYKTTYRKFGHPNVSYIPDKKY